MPAWQGYNKNSMMPKVFLHLDMNSYFASVEQQANPHLRGKPIGVVATMTPHGCIIASSVEAKAKGIKTGCRVQDARRIDPNVIIIPNDSEKYITCTAGIFSILNEYTEEIEPYSIDEAFLDLTGFVRSYDEAAAMGEIIRRRIQDEVGDWLKCSIGIAPTRWLAKFGGDTAPKGGTLIVEPNNFTETIDPRELTDAWGIANRLASRLHDLNIYTLGELRRYPMMNLIQSLGVMGYYLWANVNGIEIPGLRTSEHPKSIGHQHVFAKRATSLDYAKAVLAKLCEKAGRRLRRLDLEAYGIWISYGLSSEVKGWGRTGQSVGRKLGAPIYDTREIFDHCWQMLTDGLPTGVLPNYLAMTMFNLKPRVNQLEMFPRGKRDAPALAKSLDLVNDKYGDFTVTRGSLWGLDEHDAPHRIGFRKTVDIVDAIARRGS